MRPFEKKNPCVLIEDTSHRGWFIPRTGWDLDNRGADGKKSVEGYPERILNSVRDDRPTIFRRDVTEQFGGKITVECIYTLVDGEGFFFRLENKKDAAVRLVFRGGAFYLGDVKAFDVSYGRHYIKISVDLDAGFVTIHSDKRVAGTFAVNGTANSISAFVCGFGEKDIGTAKLTYVTKMYRDYYIYDFNIDLEEGALPADYTVSTVGRAHALNKRFGAQVFDYSYLLDAYRDSAVTVRRDFDKTCGNVILDMKYLLRDTRGKITIGLYDADTCVTELCDFGKALRLDGQGELRAHSLDVWQTLHLELDFISKTVRVKLNGKDVTVLAFKNDAMNVNNLRVMLNAASDRVTHGAIGEIFLFPMLHEPIDYVPKPIVPKKKGDYYVGMNICPLWRTGEHYGWDTISPYDEIKPLMGYYDEGIPETADWEIKFLAEHGVDFELYCWYASESDMPMRSTRLCAAWYNGHMNAKYSTDCKFALLWEAANAMHPAGSEAFRKYIVPFWIDYFFSDDRYMRIDNKAIMTVFGSGQLLKDFGSAEGVKKEFEYLRRKVKELGYDDLIILSCGADATQKACGFDGAQAYNWGKVGCDVEQTKNYIKSGIERDVITIVPTVSTGFNNVGWARTRSENMTVDGMRECLTWCRDEVLDKRPKDSWESKLVMLSNWNEYGEGTYICPSGLNGFGYLDAVRSVFCEDTPHTDVAPTEHQKSRINCLHPKDRAILGRQDRIHPVLSNDKPLLTFEFKTKKDLAKFENHGFDKLEIVDGKLVGHSSQLDPYLLYNAPLPIDPDKVSHAIVYIRGYKPVNQMCCTEMYFSRNDEGTIDVRLPPTLTVPDRIAPLQFDLYKCPEWRDEIKSFRIDPIYGVGDFIMEKIEFYAAPEHVEIRLDGHHVPLPLYAKKEGNEYYFHFDPLGVLANIKELYYHYDKPTKSLTLKGAHEAVVTVGSDVYTFDGEAKKLLKPLDMEDGMPVLPLSLFAAVVGMTIKEGDGYAELQR